LPLLRGASSSNSDFKHIPFLFAHAASHNLLGYILPCCEIRTGVNQLSAYYQTRARGQTFVRATVVGPPMCKDWAAQATRGNPEKGRAGGKEAVARW
jgi:hypothetical protein